MAHNETTIYHERHSPMLNKIKTGAVTVKNHVQTHKATYAASAVAITAITIQQRNLRAFGEFLEMKGIDPLEFLNPEALAEIQS